MTTDTCRIWCRGGWGDVIWTDMGESGGNSDATDDIAVAPSNPRSAWKDLVDLDGGET